MEIVNQAFSTNIVPDLTNAQDEWAKIPTETQNIVENPFQKSGSYFLLNKLINDQSSCR